MMAGWREIQLYNRKFTKRRDTLQWMNVGILIIVIGFSSDNSNK